MYCILHILEGEALVMEGGCSLKLRANLCIYFIIPGLEITAGQRPD